MSESLEKIVGTRIWLDYFDQNYMFEDACTPQACDIIRRFTDDYGQKDWYLIKLEIPFDYEGKRYDHLMIRSRWVGCKIGGKKPTAVFIVLVPNPQHLRDPFHMERPLYVAWGMAYRDTATAHEETRRRQKAVEIMDSIQTILFNDWDPIGVNDSAPKTEYDAYIAVIYRSLWSGA